MNSKIGAGIIGTSLGYAAIGNPLSIVSLILGTMITAGGLSAGAIVAALKKENQGGFKAVGRELWRQAQQLPEAMLTSFCIGLLVAKVQKLATPSPTSPQGIKDRVDVYLKRSGLGKDMSKPTFVQINSNAAFKLKPGQVRLNIQTLSSGEVRLHWYFPPTGSRFIISKISSSNISLPPIPSPSVIPSLISGIIPTKR